MRDVTLLELLKHGVHFGHQTGRWHPKMQKYIFSSRNGVSIIDLEKTKEQLERAYAFVRDTAAKGNRVLFVATKRQAKGIVEAQAKRADAPYVTERWIGGTFTNFSTVSKQLKKLKQLKEERDTGAWEKKYKKHEQLVFEEEIERLEKMMGGIAYMDRLPGAIFIIDMKQEKTAVLEAKKMNIPIVAMVDTNVNPELAAYPIPANDDATKSIELIASLMADAILEGKELVGAAQQVPAVQEKHPKDAAPERADAVRVEKETSLT